MLVVGEQERTSDEPWLVARHIGARVEVWKIEGWAPATGPAAWANGARRLLDRGAASMDDDRRALFTGLVIGDDRRQPLTMADDFRGAGLTHLLAVSGQNVAFVLVVAAPVLRRLRLWPRLLSSVAVIGLFGLVTRFEPSVLRAGAVAALAVLAATIGRPAARVRLLALAVTVLLLVDPLLARSVGFRLSVAASAAILLLAAPIARALPGPSWFRQPLSVTVAAQLGVAPLLLATFGPLPVATLPANLLAVPAAGFVMAWGLVAGLAAGVVGGRLAALLHAPTDLALAWIAGVARVAAAAPLGRLGPVHVAAAVVGMALALVGRRRGLARVGLSVAVAAVLVASLGAHAPAPVRSAPMPGVVVWRQGGGTVVVVGEGSRGRGPSAAGVLEALRADGVRRVDVLVLATSGVDAAGDAIAERYGPRGLVGAPARRSPSDHRGSTAAGRHPGGRSPRCGGRPRGSVRRACRSQPPPRRTSTSHAPRSPLGSSASTFATAQSWSASSTARPTRSSIRAATSTSTPFCSRQSGWSTRAPTCSTSAASRQAPVPR